MKPKKSPQHAISGSSNAGLSASELKRKRRRSVVEPVIGHLKSDHRLDRCFLWGREGDRLNLVGSAVGFNVRKLLSLLGVGIFSRALGEGWYFCCFVRRFLDFFIQKCCDGMRRKIGTLR